MRASMRVGRRCRWPTLLILLVLSHAAPALDVTGALSGSVADSQHAVVVGAAVRARSVTTNMVRETRTDGRGEFTLALLPPGTYEVSVTSPGFREAILPFVRVDLDSITRMDFVLPLGIVEQRIVVSGAPPLINAQNGTVGEVMDGARIAALPLNERNFLVLGLLTAGAEPGTDGSQNTILGSALSINGVREQSNYFLLDGVDNNDPFLNQFSVLPSVEAIDEFKVQSSNSSAQFGRSAGGQINVALKTGGNQFHGGVFAFLRNRRLDARNYFDLPSCAATTAAGACGEIPRFDRNQFGGSIGGPMRQDKTFFFAADEGLVLSQAITRQASVPSEELRAGLLAGLAPPLINPSGLAVLDRIPAANSGNPLTSTRYIAAPVLTETEQMPVIRMDHQIAYADHLSGHYALYRQNRFNPFDPGVPAFSNLPGYGSPERTLGQNLGISWVHVLGPSATNEAKFGFNRNSFGGLLEGNGQGNPTLPGFPVTLTRPVDLGYPDIQITGYDGIGGSTSLPMQRHNNTFQVADDMAWHPALDRGIHQLSFGADILRIANNSYIDEFSRGFYSFLGVSGNSIEDLLLGVPSVAISVSGNTFTNLRSSDIALYAQDDIQFHPRLTVNAGLRYETSEPPFDAGNRLSIPDFSANSVACTPRPDCMFLVAGSNGIPRGLYRSNRSDFAPRIGFAWRPSGSDRFVLRSAYGIFYDMAILNVTFGSRLNPPFYPVQVFVNSGANVIQNIFNSPLTYPLAFTMPRSFPDATVQQWNLGYQMEVAQGLAFELGYVGSKGTHLLLRRDANQPVPGGAAPHPQFTTVQQIEAAADSEYHSLQARLVRRYGNGLEFQAAYTWSKSIDDASQLFSTAVDPGFPQNSNDLSAERALSDFDARQRLVASYVYQTPNLHHGYGLMSGWVAAGTVTAQTGRPFTVNRSVLQSRTGIQAYIDRPDQVSDPTKPGAVPANADPACHLTISQGGRAADVTHTAAEWFNPCAFSDPNLLGDYRFGTAPRNSVVGPGFVDFDVSVLRNVRLGDHIKLQLRAELFNLFNHPNFDGPDRVFDSPTFGSFVSANAYGNRPPRQLQIGIRFSF